MCKVERFVLTIIKGRLLFVCECFSFSPAYGCHINKLVLLIYKLTTQIHCHMKTDDDVTGSSNNTVSHRDVY